MRKRTARSESDAELGAAQRRTDVEIANAERRVEMMVTSADPRAPGVDLVRKHHAVERGSENELLRRLMLDAYAGRCAGDRRVAVRITPGLGHHHAALGPDPRQSDVGDVSTE